MRTENGGYSPLTTTTAFLTHAVRLFVYVTSYKQLQLLWYNNNCDNQNYLQNIIYIDEICVKDSGDGARFSHSSSFLRLLSFAGLPENVLSDADTCMYKLTTG